ncbi:MAG: YdcF family protein [Fluviibacter phosphoraccumulans]
MISFIKILTWFASPIGILTLSSLSSGVLFALHKASRVRIFLITLGIGQLLFFASPWTAHALNDGLDAKARQLEAQNKGGPYTAILVLGGMIDLDPANGIVNFGKSFDRLWYAAALYHQGLSHKIIVSGGNMVADHYPDAPTQAHLMKDALIKLGIPIEAIIIEPEALTTRQHMPLVRSLMEDHNLQGQLAMVTSASHMARAMNNARQSGLDVDAYPTDWNIAIPSKAPIDQWLPRSRYLEDSETAVKEWLSWALNY